MFAFTMTLYSTYLFVVIPRIPTRFDAEIHMAEGESGCGHRNHRIRIATDYMVKSC